MCLHIQGWNMSPIECLFVPSIRRAARYRQYDRSFQLVQNCQHMTFPREIPPQSIRYDILQILTETLGLWDWVAATSGEVIYCVRFWEHLGDISSWRHRCFYMLGPAGVCFKTAWIKRTYSWVLHKCFWGANVLLLRRLKYQMFSMSLEMLSLILFTVVLLSLSSQVKDRNLELRVEYLLHVFAAMSTQYWVLKCLCCSSAV